jgi:hypothetical protein
MDSNVYCNIYISKVTTFDNIEINIQVHTHIYVETNLIISKSTYMYITYIGYVHDVDFDIIKFVSTDICVCTCMWTSILSNFVVIDIHITIDGHYGA